MDEYDIVEQYDLYQAEIDSLKDEIERLREALAMAHDHFLRLQDFIPKNGWAEYDRVNVLIEIRAALGEGKE